MAGMTLGYVRRNHVAHSATAAYNYERRVESRKL